MRAPSAADPAARAGEQGPAPSAFPGHRAEPPRAPLLSAAAQKAQREHTDYLRDREGKERRSVLRGLVLLAIVVLLISIFRAGWDRAFFTGWWRLW